MNRQPTKDTDTVFYFQNINREVYWAAFILPVFYDAKSASFEVEFAV